MTYLISVERFINERPLTFRSDSDILEPIRPIDIINPSNGEPFEVQLNPTTDLEEDENFNEKRTSKQTLLEAYKKTMLRSEIFWREWSENYLLSLREQHHKQKKGKKFPEKGQVVVVRDSDEIPRSQWKLGRIKEIISDRTVKVQIGNKIFERSNLHLYPLEIELEVNESAETNMNNISVGGMKKLNNEQTFTGMSTDRIPDDSGDEDTTKDREQETDQATNQVEQRIAEIVSSLPKPPDKVDKGKKASNEENNPFEGDEKAEKEEEGETMIVRSPVLMITDHAKDLRDEAKKGR